MYTFYCDESGNTGNNYLDEKDPFFVIGGWLIDSNREQEISTAIQKHGLSEIKAQKLSKNPQGRKKLNNIIQELIKSESIPFLSVVHKKYALVARMVDVLLDPEYNDIMPRSITRDEWIHSKKKLADIIFSSVDDLTIRKFANAYRSLDPSEMNNCIELIAEQLFSNYKCLSYLILNSRKKIDLNLADEKESKNNQAPNIYSVYTLMCMLNDYLISKEITTKFVHDEQREFSESLMIFKNIMLQNRKDTIRYNFSQKNVFFCNITEFKFQDSKENIFIQCADSLVGTVNFLLKKLEKKENFDRTERELCKTVFPIIHQWVSTEQSHIMCSNGYYMDLFNHVKKQITI